MDGGRRSIELKWQAMTRDDVLPSTPILGQLPQPKDENLLKPEDLGDRLRRVELMVKANPDSLGLRVVRCRVFWARGEWKNVIEDCDCMLRFSPQSAAALYWRAFARAQLGDWTEAAKDAVSSLELTPDQPDLRALNAALTQRLLHSRPRRGTGEGAEEQGSTTITPPSITKPKEQITKRRPGRPATGNYPGMSIRMSPELQKAVRAAADASGMTIGAFVTAALEKAVKGKVALAEPSLTEKALDARVRRALRALIKDETANLA